MQHPTPTCRPLLQAGLPPGFPPRPFWWPAGVRPGLALGVVLLAASTAHGQTHSFTDSKGSAFSAEVLAVKNGEVIVKRPDGKSYSLDLKTMPVADQEFIRTWKPTAELPRDAVATTESDIEIKIIVEPAVARDTSARGPSLLAPRVRILNQETTQTFKGLKGTVLLIGQQPGPAGRFKVLAVQSFTVDLTAAGLREYAGGAVAETAASVLAGQPAYQYKGFLFVLQNSENNIIQFQHSDAFGKNAVDTLKLNVGEIFLPRRPVGFNAPRVVGPSPSRGGRKTLPVALPTAP